MSNAITGADSADEPREKFKPRARVDGLVVEELDGELLIYDTKSDKAHCLNGAAALVWKNCDGERSVEDLSSLVTGVEDAPARLEVVILALHQLDQRKLMLDVPGAEESSSRRDLLRKVAIAGAVGLSIPVIKSIVAPTAAQAATCRFPGAACTASAQCCSGVCAGGFCL